MGETQKNPLGNDVKAAIMQQNLRDLFESAHQHPVKSALPASRDGSSQDIHIVDDGTNVYLCVRTSRGWFRTDALTQL